MNKIIYVLVITVIAGLFSGCDRSEEMIPGYLYIPNITLETNPSFEGTNSAKITDVYVYVEGTFLGVYPLPATVPILEEGTKEIQLFPGIRVNGITNLSDDYPFYRRKVTTIDFQPTKIDTINFVTSYIDQCDFLFDPEVGFESSNLVFDTDLDGNADNGLELTDEEVFEGEHSGKIHLERSQGIVEVGSIFLTNIPEVNGSSYLELNYKGDIPFFVGVIGYSGNEVAVNYYNKGINTKTEWNKIYLNLDEEMDRLRRSTQTITGYRIGILADFSVVTGINEGTIYLDNIKFIQSL